MLFPARAKWKNIGIELEVDMGTLNTIEEHCRSDPDKCLPEMLDHWLKQVNPSPSWEALAEALGSAPIGEGHLAEQIRQKYCTQSGGKAESSNDQCLKTELIATTLKFIMVYSDYLKTRYIGSPQIPDNKWPPTPSTKYINLACIDRQEIRRHEADEFTRYTIHGNIDDIYRRKTNITIEHVAHKIRERISKDVIQESFPKVVLVGGAPGVGKSTFAWELCRRWTSGELLDDYSLVVLVRLRDRYAREAKTLVDIFPFHKETVSKSLVDEMLEINGRSILFVLEGFDELPERMRTESIYLHLVKGDLLPAATVLVTSRPWALSDFHWRYRNRISQWIEILGFTKHQIDEYLISYSNGDCKFLDNLRRYVSLNPPIHAAMYVPLNTVIVCEVYKDGQTSDCVIPSTMTELYTAFSLILLIRYRIDQGQEVRLKKFDDLPQAIYDKFLEICKIAYKGIKNDQQLIFSHLPDDFETLGFMQSIPELHTIYGVSYSHNFLHLTVQEFLAAYFLSQHKQYLESEQIWLSQSASVGTVTTFLAGITKLQSSALCRQLPVPSIEPLVMEVELAVHSSSGLKRRIRNVCINNQESGVHLYAPNQQNVGLRRNNAVVDLSLDVLEKAGVEYQASLGGNTLYSTWLYESQNMEKLQEYLGCGTVLIKVTPNMTPMECFATGWCIGNSSCELRLCFCGTEKPFSIDCIEMLRTGLKHSKTSTFHIICELYIGQGVVESTPVTQQAFFDLLVDPECFNTVKTGYFYGLSNTCVYKEPGNIIKHFYSCLPTLLETLLCVDLSGANLTLADYADPIVLFLTKATKLNTLILKACESQDVACVVKALTANKCLKTLDLSGSRLSMTRTSGLSPVLLDARQVLSVKSQELQVLSEVLQVNQTLQVLKLNDCCLTMDETSILFEIFARNQNTTLQTLAMSGNYYNTQHFKEMLSSNSSLQCVEISVTRARYPKFPLSPMKLAKRPQSLVKHSHHPLCPKTHAEYLRSPMKDASLKYLPVSPKRSCRTRKHDVSDKVHSVPTFTTSLRVLEYVGDDETPDSVCQVIVSAVNKNTTLKQLIIHTAFGEILLKSTLMQCPNYNAVKHRIHILRPSSCSSQKSSHSYVYR